MEICLDRVAFLRGQVESSVLKWVKGPSWPQTAYETIPKYCLREKSQLFLVLSAENTWEDSSVAVVAAGSPVSSQQRLARNVCTDLAPDNKHGSCLWYWPRTKLLKEWKNCGKNESGGNYSSVKFQLKENISQTGQTLTSNQELKTPPLILSFWVCEQLLQEVKTTDWFVMD